MARAIGTAPETGMVPGMAHATDMGHETGTARETGATTRVMNRLDVPATSRDRRNRHERQSSNHWTAGVERQSGLLRIASIVRARGALGRTIDGFAGYGRDRSRP